MRWLYFIPHYYLTRILLPPFPSFLAGVKGTSLAHLPLRHYNSRGEHICQVMVKVRVRRNWPFPGASFLYFKAISLTKASGTGSRDLRIKPTGFQMGLVFCFFLVFLDCSSQSSVQIYLFYTQSTH